MRPTRRGYAVIGVVVAALVAGATFGARTLDAIVLPGIVALVAAVIQLRRVPRPDLDRTVPPADVAGTAGTVTLALDGDRTAPVRIRDQLPDGIEPAGEGRAAGGEAVVDAAVGGEAVTYGIVPQRRGEHVVGPATVVATDVLGLLKRSTVLDRRDTLVTFPRVGTLPAALGADLRGTYRSRLSTQRDEFDDLREYVRGDALRDIHWKSSARHDQLMVREFADRTDPERVTVAVGVDPGVLRSVAGGDGGEEGTVVDGSSAVGVGDTPADRMADAAATVCVALLGGGASVTLHTPSGEASASPGRIRPALRHLATAEGGRVPTPAADVVVVATGDGVSVRVDGREHRLEGRIGGTRSLESVSEGIGGDTPDGRSEDGVGAAPDAWGAAGDRGVASDGAGRRGPNGEPLAGVGDRSKREDTG